MRIARLAIAALALALGAMPAYTALGQEIVLKNDNLPDVMPPTGVPIGFEIYFAALEEVNVWLTAPCNGTIVAVQVLWGVSGQPTIVPTASVENAITFFQPGVYPFRSNTPLLNQLPTPNTPAELIGPVMQGNALHEFRFLDENNTVPLSIPVVAGQTFVVSFEFGENHHINPGPDTPTIPVDVGDGVMPGRNGIFGIPGGFLCWGTPVCPNSFNIPGSGDFIIRVKMVCTLDSGACCLPSGQCINSQTQAGCTSQGGVWQGADSLCSGVTCTQPTGACCTGSGCSVITASECTALSGSYRGNGTTCNSTICNGACCIPSTQGCGSTTQGNCTLLGGTFQGVGVTCGSVVCFPMGACCLEDGSCAPGPMSPEACVAMGGSFKGHQSTCASPCPQPIGKCCVQIGKGYVCLDGVEQGDCTTNFGGVWGGPNSACTVGNCPPCFADINADGQVNVTDLLTVIGAWGPCTNCPADIAPSPFGDNQVNVSDLLMVIGGWGTCQ